MGRISESFDLLRKAKLADGNKINPEDKLIYTAGYITAIQNFLNAQDGIEDEEEAVKYVSDIIQEGNDIIASERFKLQHGL